MPYLTDQMMRISTFPHISDLTHGNQKKTERITWALEGRFEHGRIFFREGAEFIEPLTSQLIDFPNPLSHDDLVDALAYIDQIAVSDYDLAETEDSWWDHGEDLDEHSGRNPITGY